MAKTSSKKSTESFDIIEESPAPKSKKTSSDSSSSAGGGKRVFNSRILLSTLSVVLGIVVIILTILLCIQPKETFTKTKKTSIEYLGEFNDDNGQFDCNDHFVENMRKLMGIKKLAEGDIKAWQLPFSESELIKMYLTFQFTGQLKLGLSGYLSNCFEFVDDLKYSDFNNTLFNIEYNYKNSKLHAIISFFINSSVYERNIAIPQSVVIDFTLYDFKLIPYTIPSDNLIPNAMFTEIALLNDVKAFNFYYYASSRSNGNYYINYSDYIESNVFYLGLGYESPDKYFSNKLYTSQFTSFFVSNEMTYIEFPKLKTIVINNENEPDQWTEYLDGYDFDKLNEYLSDIPKLATIASNDKLVKNFIKDIYSPKYADGQEHPEINIYDYISGFKEQTFDDFGSNTPDIQLYKDRATFYFKINNIENLDLDKDIEWKVSGNDKPITITPQDTGVPESVTWDELKGKNYYTLELANYIKKGFIDCWSNPDSAYSIVPANSGTRGTNTYNRTIFSLPNKLVYSDYIKYYDWSISDTNELPDEISSIEFNFNPGNSYSSSLISYVNKNNIELCFQMPWSTKTDGTEYPIYGTPHPIDLIEFFSSTLSYEESVLILGKNLIDYTKLSLPFSS